MNLKRTAFIILIYGMSFVFIKEIIATHKEWRHDKPYIPHNLYNHTATPNFSGVSPIGFHGDYLLKMKINSQGLRKEKDTKIPKPEGTYRILMVGDSFVAGTNVRLPVILEQSLNKTFGGHNIFFEVINCGQASYSPILHLARLKHQYLSFEPDAIIYFPDLTDVYDDNHRYKWLAKFDDNGELIRVSGSTRILRAKRRHLRYLRQWAKKLSTNENTWRDVISYQKTQYPHIYDHSREKEDQPSKYTIEETRFTLGFIKKFIETARLNNIHISIAMYPHLLQIVRENRIYGTPFNVVHNRFFEKSVEKSARDAKVPFISFYRDIQKRVLAGEELYMFGDMHFNDAGFNFLGELLSKWAIANSGQSIGFSQKSPPKDPGKTVSGN